ncbi:hypothetical protein SELMODRAFT_441302 [Selaginella moellendorffii]|uniref:9-cis-epoxycarotenoid dioxygenase n=1 Tax=Selaginella moellendorffii TaxID=88036 RepID=D8RIF4_SELML|nr:hypothetical protein SELMODRAFT_441302 [Selaginella moellendorffii]
MDKIVVSITPVEHLFDDFARLANRLHKIHLDLRSGRSWKQHVCSAGLDFGKINQKFLGQKNRYVYMCYYGPWPKICGLAKVNLVWRQGDSNMSCLPAGVPYGFHGIFINADQIANQNHATF